MDDARVRGPYAERMIEQATRPDAGPETRRPVRLLLEAAIVAGTLAIELGITAMAGHYHDHQDLGLAGTSLLVVGALALPFRRVRPVLVLWVALLTTLAYWSLGYPRGPVFAALLIAFGYCVIKGHRLAAVVAIAFGFLAFPWVGYLIDREPRPAVGAVVGLFAWLITLISVMEIVRSRKDRARERRLLEREAVRLQVADERLRMARELHDAVAHNMSLINLQAGVALHLMDEQPEQVRGALETIKQSSKEALVELRSILGVLRQVDEDAPRAPTPSLGRIDDLVTGSGAAGIKVHVDIDGDVSELPRAVDLAAFRIIQESLTNVARHSDRPEAVVRIAVSGDELRIEVLDDGSGRVRPQVLPGGGNGIPGMRERAASVGGGLEAGPRPGRGFAVRARIPLARPS
ncbi:MAG: two component system sensor kinase [Actinomycetia bacterium]|nr:two component system sensor kinase [Actinomycetes bacterium]